MQYDHSTQSWSESYLVAERGGTGQVVSHIVTVPADQSPPGRPAAEAYIGLPPPPRR
jgi:hypothetical protein